MESMLTLLWPRANNNVPWGVLADYAWSIWMHVKAMMLPEALELGTCAVHKRSAISQRRGIGPPRSMPPGDCKRSLGKAAMGHKACGPGAQVHEMVVLRFSLLLVQGVNDVAWDWDDRYLATASDHVTMLLRDTALLLVAKMSLISLYAQGVNDVAWDWDDRYLATASDDKTLLLWDAQTGERLRLLEGHTNFVFSCAFSPNNSSLVPPWVPLPDTLVAAA